MNATSDHGEPRMNRRDLMKGSALSLAALVLPLRAASPIDRPPAMEHRMVPWTHADETLLLAVTRQPGSGPATLYVHGASFPSALSVGWKMDGVSWLDQLQGAGMDAWAFDFAGYGESDRPAVFDLDATSAPPFGQFRAAARQIVAVLERIHQERRGVPIHLIAHSWGTLPVQQVAIDRPDLVSRLVLFGPVVPRESVGESQSTPPAWALYTAAKQRPRQRTGLPDSVPTPVSNEELERWCTAYLDSDPTSRQRDPRSAKVPNGPAADIGRLWIGETLVDSGRIRQPTLIVRGQWDHITTDDDAKRLFDALTGTRDKRDVKISGGNHWLHLQPRREALWAETLSFLREGGRG